jgi:hypothetical protein
VIDLSPGGALVEGSARLLPGTHADVHVVTREGRVLVRSRIVRAYVCHVAADAIRYRGGLAFEQSIDTAPEGYGLPSISPWPLGPEGSAYPPDQVLAAPNGSNEPPAE